MYFDEEEPTENHDEKDVRICKSPTEDRYGDDESKDAEEEEDMRIKRKSRRVIRVEEGNAVERVTRKGSLHHQSSSEDETTLAVTRNSSKQINSEKNKTSASVDDVKHSITWSARKPLSSTSEDDTFSRRKSFTRTNVKDRKASFEQFSSGAENEHSGRSRTSSQKRSSFSSQRANTISGGLSDRRGDSFVSSRTKSFEADGRKFSARSQSIDRPEWSSSTKVEHGKVLAHTMNRKGSSTQSESDEPKSAAQIRAKWESRSTPNILANRTRAFGGSTGAAAMKARFETQASNYKRRTSSSATSDQDPGRRERKISTANLKLQFEGKINDQAPVKRNFVINKNRGGAAAKKFNRGAPVSNRCLVCSKTVYPMEKLEADGKLFHKFCFKCTTCNRTVGLGNYAALEGMIYCKPHLKQLFKLKGNYDEGFGREQRKADWMKKDNTTASLLDDSAVGPVQQNGHTKQEIAINGVDSYQD